ncbi:MAG: hypothetical protein BWZ01_02128 [Deltaproteobacteria bacterium ADurb.BinA179]|jgi:hypothetical protein|nr:MAG: hypothetical protein BWZ01_02128 [Deltaproteobacteria bacterium ADurb.BinA179]
MTLAFVIMGALAFTGIALRFASKRSAQTSPVKES